MRRSRSSFSWGVFWGTNFLTRGVLAKACFRERLFERRCQVDLLRRAILQRNLVCFDDLRRKSGLDFAGAAVAGLLVDALDRLFVLFYAEISGIARLEAEEFHFADHRDVPFFAPGEDRHHAVVVALGEGIELVIVAP